MAKLKLYRHPLSGHSHRVEVFLSLLGLNADLIDVDLKNGEHKKAAFLTKNAFGQVPVLEDGEVTLADSNGILVYLANKYDLTDNWLPKDAVKAADVQRFLSIAAGKLAFGPAAARLANVFGGGREHEAELTIAHALLEQLNAHLADRDWLVGDTATIADVANYTYIAHAPEGDVSLQAYPNILVWLTRFEALDGFVPMQSTQVGLATN